MSLLICLVAECPVTTLVWRTFVVCTGKYLHALEIDAFDAVSKGYALAPVCVVNAERTHHNVESSHCCGEGSHTSMRKVPTAMLKLLAGISRCV
jgi:hypothetical protein